MILICHNFYGTLEHRTSNILVSNFVLLSKVTPLFPGENVEGLNNSGINICEEYFDSTIYGVSQMQTLLEANGKALNKIADKSLVQIK